MVALLALWPAGSAQAAGRCGNHPWCDTALSPAKPVQVPPAYRVPLSDSMRGISAGDALKIVFIESDVLSTCLVRAPPLGVG